MAEEDGEEAENIEAVEEVWEEEEDGKEDKDGSEPLGVTLLSTAVCEENGFPLLLFLFPTVFSGDISTCLCAYSMKLHAFNMSLPQPPSWWCRPRDDAIRHHSVPILGANYLTAPGESATSLVIIRLPRFAEMVCRDELM